MTPSLRIALATVALLIAAIVHTPAEAARVFPWCAIYSGASMGGSKSCTFNTFEQCQARLSGIGGFCQPNAFGPQERSAPRKTRRGSSRRS